ncbi:MAG: chorismate mutase [Candidatus Levybacteria bacterium]|nr:chorismate mutase [Candidatus Levybacteria bacterium]
MDKILLKKLRKDIDEIDRELLFVVAKRTDVVRKIGKLKKANNIKPLDKKRWELVLQSRISIAKSLNLDKDFIKNLYTLIHKNSLIIESEEKKL